MLDEIIHHIIAANNHTNIIFNGKELENDIIANSKIKLIIIVHHQVLLGSLFKYAVNAVISSIDPTIKKVRANNISNIELLIKI